MRDLTRDRFATILPHALSFLGSREEVRVEQLVDHATQLEGLFSWAVEQGIFTEEITNSATARCCDLASFTPAPVPAMAEVEVMQRTSTRESGIAVYDVFDRSGMPLTLLVGRNDQLKRIQADQRLVRTLIAITSGRWQIPRRYLNGLIEAGSGLAAKEADLHEEANARMLGARSARFSLPQIVREGDQFLLQTRLPGDPAETPLAAGANIYNQAATTWARMLLIDGILQVGLRRDRIYVDEQRLGVARWAGTRQSQGLSAALLRTLILSVFGSTEAVRARNKSSVTSTLADVLGLDGSLSEVEEFYLALFAQQGKLVRSRGVLSRLAVRERADYCREDRVEAFCMLRQIIWIRDIGLSCAVSDLTRPWREIAIELEENGCSAAR